MAPCVYHTTTELLALVSALSCTSVHTRNTTEDGRDIKVAMVGASKPLKQKAANKLRVMITFSIHGREYLSSEVAHSFLSTLCSGSDRTSTLLDNMAFAVVPVLNPSGRGRTDEDDAYRNTSIEAQRCTDRRKNRNKIDLNRNFDVHWDDVPLGASHSDKLADDYPGEAAMSEVETWTVKKLAEEWQPHMTIDAHTGTLAMYTPWNYKSETVSDSTDATNMTRLLDSVREATYTDGTSIWDASGKDVPWRQPDAGVGGVISYLASGTLSDYLYRPAFAEGDAMKYAFIMEMYEQLSSCQPNCHAEEAVRETSLAHGGLPGLPPDVPAAGAPAANGTDLTPRLAVKLPRGGGASLDAARARVRAEAAERAAAEAADLNAAPDERSLLPAAEAADAPARAARVAPARGTTTGAGDWETDSCFEYFNPVSVAGLKHWLGAWTEGLIVASEALAVDRGYAVHTGSRVAIDACSSS